MMVYVKNERIRNHSFFRFKFGLLLLGLSMVFVQCRTDLKSKLVKPEEQLKLKEKALKPSQEELAKLGKKQDVDNEKLNNIIEHLKSHGEDVKKQLLNLKEELAKLGKKQDRDNEMLNNIIEYLKIYENSTNRYLQNVEYWTLEGSPLIFDNNEDSQSTNNLGSDGLKIENNKVLYGVGVFEEKLESNPITGLSLTYFSDDNFLPPQDPPQSTRSGPPSPEHRILQESSSRRRSLPS